MNEFLINNGPTELCKDGAISILRYKHIKENVDEFKTDILRPVNQMEALTEDCMNEWHWGSARLGKTWHVEQTYPGGYHKTDNKWWNGYKWQEIVYIHEFREKHQITTRDLLVWADKQPFDVEVKGGFIYGIRPKRIIITSNHSPERIFGKDN